jgi:hypothetical protein
MKSGHLNKSLKTNAEHHLLANFLSDFYKFVDGKAELESVGYISHDIWIERKSWIWTIMK